MNLVRLLVGALPASAIKNWLMSHCGRSWSVHRSASVGPNLFWRVEALEVAENATIGSLNVFRDLRSIRLLAEAGIGQLNWITGTGSWIQPERPTGGRLELGEWAAILSRHYIDCAGGVTLGEKALLAGVRSTLLTHDADPREWQMRIAPITIGSHCMIGSGTIVQRGVTIADRCIVGAGSVVVKDLEQSDTFYGSPPAVAKGDLTGSKIFTRVRGNTHRGDPWHVPEPLD